LCRANWRCALPYEIRARARLRLGRSEFRWYFDNVMSGKNLDEAHAECSFSDPSIALDGGYVQVTRLNGHGPALLVVPDGKTPFEAYNPIAGAQGGAQGWSLRGFDASEHDL